MFCNRSVSSTDTSCDHGHNHNHSHLHSHQPHNSLPLDPTKGTSDPTSPLVFQKGPQMNAILYNSFGGSEELVEVQVPRPKLFRKRAILVRIHATSLNPLDWKLLSGHIPKMFLPMPKIPGCDFSGVVEECGEIVTGFKPGDEVIGVLDPLSLNGSLADYVIVIPPSILVHKPPELTHEQAASIGFAGIAAWQSLLEVGKLQPGHRVLIHGGGGGVGSLAVQLARLHGASYVAATASPEAFEYVQSLGVDIVLDYNNQNWPQQILYSEEELSEARDKDIEKNIYNVEDKKFDIVLDVAGGKSFEDSYHVIKKTGIIVSLVVDSYQSEKEILETHGVNYLFARSLYHAISSYVLGFSFSGPYRHMYRIRPDAIVLEELSKLVASGKLKPCIEEVLPVSQAALALDKLQNIHPRKGKIVLAVNQDQWSSSSPSSSSSFSTDNII